MARQGGSRFCFISSNGQWGGSEELWSLSALHLAQAGHAISVIKTVSGSEPARFHDLRSLGCRISDLRGPGFLPKKVRSAAMLYTPTADFIVRTWLRRLLLSPRADMVVISQGLNYDGLLPAQICADLGVPYVMISQKASELYWPTDRMLATLGDVYAAARSAIFVSEHNRRLTEEQIGRALPNAVVMRNPFMASWAFRDDWPSEMDGFHLTCLARLDGREKGQDTLMRVLAMPKWRSRPLKVSFVGAGQNERGLKQLASYLKLENVSFDGFTDRPEALWSATHGLVLPSRCEGLPLSLVEAMMSGRVSIVTNVGGNGEVLADGETGFIAEAATETLLDETMERAWARRAEWRSIGEAAARHIRTIVPQDPAKELANTLLGIIAASRDARS